MQGREMSCGLASQPPFNLKAISEAKLGSSVDDCSPNAAKSLDNDITHAACAAPSAVQLQLPGGQSFAAFMGLWDTLTVRLLPLYSTGAAADMLLAALRLMLASAAASAAKSISVSTFATAASTAGPGGISHEQTCNVPRDVQQLLGVALQLADLSSAGLPINAAAIAAGVLAGPLLAGRLSVAAAEDAAGHAVGRLLEHLAAVHSLPAAVDVYNDATCRSLHCLKPNLCPCLAIFTCAGFRLLTWGLASGHDGKGS